MGSEQLRARLPQRLVPPVSVFAAHDVVPKVVFVDLFSAAGSALKHFEAVWIWIPGTPGPGALQSDHADHPPQTPGVALVMQ